MMSVHSSASRASAIDVEPRTSQKSIVTTRRSPEGSRDTPSRAPHSLQNLALETFMEPQAGHAGMARTIATTASAWDPSRATLSHRDDGVRQPRGGVARFPSGHPSAFRAQEQAPADPLVAALPPVQGPLPRARQAAARRSGLHAVGEEPEDLRPLLQGDPDPRQG